jgi:iron(III) transport system substrate-binding protein
MPREVRRPGARAPRVPRFARRVAAALRRCGGASLLCVAAACGSGKTPLVIYSPHGRDLLGLLERRFEAENPDVDVRWLDMGSQDAYDRIRSERANPQADLWFGGPHILFARAARESLLTATAGDTVWVSVYRTPAVIAYNTQRVDSASAPRDWDDVLDPRWRDKVLIRDPLASGTMRAIFGMVMERSLRATGDTAQGVAWLRRLDAQTKEYVFHGTLLTEKIGRQEGLITLWDLPDLLLTVRSGRPLAYTFPTSGTPVIDDAIAVVRGSEHVELARRYAAWVRSSAIQILAAREALRLPARTDLPADSLPEWVRDVEARMVADPMDWDVLEREGPAWMAYWDRHVRNSGRRAR